MRLGSTNQLPARTAPTAQYSRLTQSFQQRHVELQRDRCFVQHRFSVWGGGLFQFNYVYGHAFDIISNGGFNPFADNSAGSGAVSLHTTRKIRIITLNYGPADYDVRHSLNANYVWQVPFRKMMGGHGWAPLVEGWQVSGAVYYRTGFPFSVIDGVGFRREQLRH